MAYYLYSRSIIETKLAHSPPLLLIHIVGLGREACCVKDNYWLYVHTLIMQFIDVFLTLTWL